jgi:pimeloyl-ACP methyl ester carboxylesterase
MRLTATGHAGARDVVRHATTDLPGNVNRARAWGRLARGWERPQLMDAYAQVACPTLLLWADGDPWHPLDAAEEAEDLLPDAQLRTLSATGFLLAYDDPVGVAREIAAFA